MRTDTPRTAASSRPTPVPVLGSPRRRQRRRVRTRTLAVTVVFATVLFPVLWIGTLDALRAIPLGGLLPLLASPHAAADEGEGPPKLSSRYRRVARFEVPVEEISGWTPLPGSDDPRTRRFLAVSDEGTFRADERSVEGALFEVECAVSDDGTVSFVRTRPVRIHLGDLIPRLDPAWARGHSIFDLEACVPLPGTEDLYLLAGERNPEDATDGGANRLYVIRYPAHGSTPAPPTVRPAPPTVPPTVPPAAPAPEPGPAVGGPAAQLLGYVRTPDLADDATNDRFEAVAAVAGPEPDTWLVFAFKERTEAPGRPPVYLPMQWRRIVGTGGSSDAFVVTSPHFQRTPLRLPALIADRNRLGAQSDACLGPRGNVWVLDRWRRELHLAEVVPPPALGLRHGDTLDIHDLIGDVPGEDTPAEPAAPGGRHAGYGRHEAMCFDANGWLWLAADRGGGRPSVVTVLAPKSCIGGVSGASEVDGGRSDAGKGAREERDPGDGGR